MRLAVLLLSPVVCSILAAAVVVPAMADDPACVDARVSVGDVKPPPQGTCGTTDPNTVCATASPTAGSDPQANALVVACVPKAIDK